VPPLLFQWQDGKGAVFVSKKSVASGLLNDFKHAWGIPLFYTTFAVSA